MHLLLFNAQLILSLHKDQPFPFTAPLSIGTTNSNDMSTTISNHSKIYNRKILCQEQHPMTRPNRALHLTCTNNATTRHLKCVRPVARAVDNVFIVYLIVHYKYYSLACLHVPLFRNTLNIVGHRTQYRCTEGLSIVSSATKMQKNTKIK